MLEDGEMKHSLFNPKCSCGISIFPFRSNALLHKDIWTHVWLFAVFGLSLYTVEQHTVIYKLNTCYVVDNSSVVQYKAGAVITMCSGGVTGNFSI